MTLRSIIDRVRRTLLQATFSLLYTKLGFLHEATGRLAYGGAWEGRRKHVTPTETTGTVVDLGCGEGRLLATLRNTGVFALGVEPSGQMAQRAVKRNVFVVQAIAQALPVQSGSVQCIVATYPGPWMVDSRTWDEIARVTAPGARIAILLGGDYSRGRWSSIRRPLLRLAYGRPDTTVAIPDLGHPSIAGGIQVVDDTWGEAMLWCGVRSDDGVDRSP